MNGINISDVVNIIKKANNESLFFMMGLIDGELSNRGVEFNPYFSFKKEESEKIENIIEVKNEENKKNCFIFSIHMVCKSARSQSYCAAIAEDENKALKLLFDLYFFERDAYMERNPDAKYFPHITLYRAFHVEQEEVKNFTKSVGYPFEDDAMIYLPIDHILSEAERLND